MDSPSFAPRHSELKVIKLDDIDDKDRVREDYGKAAEWEDFKQSILAKGVFQPVTVRLRGPEDGNDPRSSSRPYKLLAGGRRVRASRELGLSSIPALVYATSGVVDSLEIELFENIHRKALSWQEEATLIQKIHNHEQSKDPEWGQRETAELLDRSVGGINRKLEIAQFLGEIPELGQLRTEDDAIKAIRKMEEKLIIKELARRQREESSPTLDLVRIAGSHYRIGDAIEGLKGIASNCTAFRLIECDPPYGIELHQAKAGEVDEYSEVDAAKYPDFIRELTKELYRVAPSESWLIFWFGPTWHCLIKQSLEDAGWTVDPIPGIWSKGSGQTKQPSVNLARAYEPFFICRKGNPVLHTPGRSNVFNYAPVPPKEKTHPTQRPLDLMVEIINTFAFPGSSILVPFLGSGATLIAGYTLDMTGVGWDLSQEHKDRFLLRAQKIAEFKLQHKSATAQEE